MESVRKKIQHVVARKLNLDPGQLIPESNFALDLGADSLDLVQLVMAIEAAFDIDVPDSDFAELQTMNDVTQYVLKRGELFA
ncbi:MAG: acyl carrier protein [bacterium]|nr:acyl carrier protein [bacterium]